MLCCGGYENSDLDQTETQIFSYKLSRQECDLANCRRILFKLLYSLEHQDGKILPGPEIEPGSSP